MIDLELNEVIWDTRRYLYLFSVSTDAAWAKKNYAEELARIGITDVEIAIVPYHGQTGIKVRIPPDQALKLIRYWKDKGDLKREEDIPVLHVHDAKAISHTHASRRQTQRGSRF